MFKAKIIHCPFGEPFVSKDNLTQVTEISSEGLNYMQFCSLIGQITLNYGVVNVELRYVSPSKTEEEKF